MMKKWIITLVAMGLAYGVQAGTLITSDGAWDNTSVIALSNGGVQTNYNFNGGFSSAAGKDYYSSNANAVETNFMYMAAVSGNPELTYQAGKTYIYQIQGYAAIASHSNTQNVMLIAGGDAAHATAKFCDVICVFNLTYAQVMLQAIFKQWVGINRLVQSVGQFCGVMSFPLLSYRRRFLLWLSRPAGDVLPGAQGCKKCCE